MQRFLKTNPLNILVIEDNFGDYVLLKESIYLSSIPATTIELADTLESAVDFLSHSKPDVIFLDLFLPDSAGLSSFEEVQNHAQGSAIIVLSGASDTRTALEAIGKGALDYLAKGEFDIKLLEKTIIYALERRKSLESLKLANELYRLVSKATNDLVWDWDVETNRVHRDEDAASALYGLGIQKQIVRIEDWMKRVHEEDLPKVSEELKKITHDSLHDSFEMEYRYNTCDGRWRIISDRGYAVRNTEGKVIRIVGAAKDITEKRKLEQELQKNQQLQQRAITEATIRGQENERTQLGLELHDNITQILATSKLYLDFACNSEEIKKDLIIQGKQLIMVATEELRKLSHSLLPPSLDQLGLCQALHDLANKVSLTGAFQIERNWDDSSEEYLERDQKLTIFRIIQEQLNNIIKHAGAKAVCISLSIVLEDEELHICVKDDGKGFHPSQVKNGVGLRNITSRAELYGGRVSIVSAPGAGCELKVVFPLNQNHKNN